MAELQSIRKLITFRPTEWRLIEALAEYDGLTTTDVIRRAAILAARELAEMRQEHREAS